MPPTRLDPRETHLRIPDNQPGRTLFLRHLPPESGTGQVVLYVHGGTFPSALPVAYRFDGRSWRDELCDAGFHVRALDFAGAATAGVASDIVARPVGPLYRQCAGRGTAGAVAPSLRGPGTGLSG
nr:hypothetical protein [uncultured Rhodopila sp.]